MKTITRSVIPFFILLLGVTTSCEKESVEGGLISSQKPLTFRIGNGKISSTRSAEDGTGAPSSTLLCAIPIAEASGIEENPTLLVSCSESSLDDEWLLSSDFDAESSVTRGTPVFTENLGSFAANTYASLSVDDEYTDIWCGMKDAVFERGTGNKSDEWSHFYGNNESWPSGNGDLVFFMCYPVGATDDLGLSYWRENGKNVIKFTGYTTPVDGNTDTDADAEAQTDLVFATTMLNESDCDKDSNPILFYHPFSGVKFKVGELPEGVAIENVTLDGVYSTGDCAITPYYGNTAISGWEDSNKVNGAVSGSKSDACVVWSGLGNSSSFGQDFASTDHKTTLNTGSFPSDFVDTPNTMNQDQLNTETLSKTFILIPQKFEDGHKLSLTVRFKYTDGTAQQATTEMPVKEWMAGHLYTYSLSYKYGPIVPEIDVTEFTDNPSYKLTF